MQLTAAVPFLSFFTRETTVTRNQIDAPKRENPPPLQWRRVSSLSSISAVIIAGPVFPNKELFDSFKGLSNDVRNMYPKY